MLEDGVWMTAEHLGAGYRIVNSDGIVSVVEGIECISYNEGKAIYNLNVEDNHTYFVSQEKVCVHNDCMVTAEGVERVLNAIPKGTPTDINWNDFQALTKGYGNTAEKAAAYSKFSKKDIKKISKIQNSDKLNLAGKTNVEQYAELVNSNKVWNWAEDIEGGAELTAKQRRAIRQEAIERGLIPDVKMKPGTKYPDFESSGLIKKVDQLPIELWDSTDREQFKWLDNRIEGGRPDGTTWHHSEIDGRMELVPFGIHNIINHKGGRSLGNWSSKGKR